MNFLGNFSFGEIAAIIIFFIGVYGIIARRNIVKTVISLGIMETAIILFFVASSNAYEKAPILNDTIDSANIADPIPQALMITAIVIGVGVTAIALTMFINLYHKYGTTNWEKAKIVRDKEQ
ncbi:MAG: cation:proton antiporter subunit C [Eubacteriales bacterium]